MPKQIEDALFVRLSDLAEESGAHQHSIEKMLFYNVISADGYITHGKSRQPIFLESRMPELLERIRLHKAANT